LRNRNYRKPPYRFAPLLCKYICTYKKTMLAMEEWGHADDRVIQRQYSKKVCMSCAWFTYGIDAHCHTCVGCALMEALLEQGQHLTHGCRNWKPVHHVETGPAVTA